MEDTDLCELFHALDNLETFKIEGRDKRGRRILRIVGKHFPARVALGEEVVRRYLEERVFPDLMTDEGRKCEPFCIVYFHTDVSRVENFPGFSALRCLYENLPSAVREALMAVYFVHPGLLARLFLATFGLFLFGAGLYGKVRYINRLVYLWEHVRRTEVELPEFVVDHDDELECRPFMDYGIDTDHCIVHDAPTMDSAASMYSRSCMC